MCNLLANKSQINNILLQPTTGFHGNKNKATLRYSQRSEDHIDYKFTYNQTGGINHAPIINEYI